MDWFHIPYTLEEEVMISINLDAHSISEIDKIMWGVFNARKGGLTKETIWNTMPLKKLNVGYTKGHVDLIRVYHMFCNTKNFQYERYS